MMEPPTPGNVSCGASRDFRSASMPADSNRPFTTMASISCSESNTFTNFSFGSGLGSPVSGAGFIGSAMYPPYLRQIVPLGDANPRGLVLHQEEWVPGVLARHYLKGLTLSAACIVAARWHNDESGPHE